MPLIDITGRRFGRWTVVARDLTSTGPPRWLCRCDCGTEKIQNGQAVRSQTSKSCGCLKRELEEAKSITLEEQKIRRSARAKTKAQSAVRKTQKQEAQMRYRVTDKALLAALARWFRKRTNKREITDEQYLELREKPCHRCGCIIEGVGVGFVLVKPRSPVSFDNVLPMCGVCRLTKPKEKFNPIAFSKTVLRRFWKRTPMVSIAKQKARKGRGRYECADCKEIFAEKATQVDHIAPVVDPLVGFVDLSTFATRLFCDDSNLQVLCLSCHSKKTANENVLREAVRKERK
jgi:5-methylcytosine-specific restriction endonuclease McrA